MVLIILSNLFASEKALCTYLYIWMRCLYRSSHTLISLCISTDPDQKKNYTHTKTSFFQCTNKSHIASIIPTKTDAFMISFHSVKSSFIHAATRSGTRATTEQLPSCFNVPRYICNYTYIYTYNKSFFPFQFKRKVLFVFVRPRSAIMSFVCAK